MIGIDEVGRGSWAGPLLVVAARQTGDLPLNLTDSKLMTRRARQEILEQLNTSCFFGEGWVSASEIDENGLATSMRIGVARALASISAGYEEEIVMDGKIDYTPEFYKYVTCVVQADRKIGAVSAASVYAKVTRDKYMNDIKIKHPGYGFEKHVGYGTRLHAKMLRDKGVIAGVHRYSFKPVKLILAQ